MAKQKKIERALNAYLVKPYARILTPDPNEKIYTAQILEFPGCIAEGVTPTEAYARLDNAAAAWIQSMLESGRDIPEPTFEKIRDYSGKVALRLPRNIHREAMRHAELQRTSLNTFLVSSVSAGVGAMNLYDKLTEMIER